MTNSTQNLFETAVRNRYRFNFKGLITVEDLFSLSVQELDTIFKALNKELKQVEEESLLNTKSAEDAVVENKIAIIKSIVAEKITEAEQRKNAQVIKAQDQKIMAIIQAKEEEELLKKSPEELRAMLSEANK